MPLLFLGSPSIARPQIETFPDSFTVQVRWWDVICGLRIFNWPRLKSQTCPLARAVKREIGFVDASVSGTDALFYRADQCRIYTHTGRDLVWWFDSGAWFSQRPTPARVITFTRV